MSPYLFILNTHCGVTFSLSQSFEWTGSQSAFDVAAKNTSSSAILDTDRLLFVNSAESAHRTLMTSSVRTSRKSVRSPLQHCFFGFFSVDQATASTKLWWTTTVTAKPKTSRQKQKHHGKIKNLTTKTKYLTAKTKYLTAKTKTSRQTQILHSKNKTALVLAWVFAFPISGNAFDGKRRKKGGCPNTCSVG